MLVKVLVVDDEPDMRWAIVKALERNGYDTREASSGEDALEQISRNTYHLVILDYRMPGMNGMSTLEQIKKESPESRVIFMTAHGNDDLAMKSLELGADDFLHKPFDMKNLVFRVMRTTRYLKMEAEVTALRSRDKVEKTNVIAESPAMKEVFRQVGKIAGFDAPVIIYGETGTGKEVVSYAIHHNENNPRINSPYVTVNSAAVTETLIESELFGHVKGAFTGAVGNKRGFFETADGGTLFLDEVSSAPLSLQSKLLRVLDSGEFMRVGESKIRKAQVRLIVATNKDLWKEVEQGRFREDLYHRMNVFRITLPPLRERGEDIKLLIEHFLNYSNKKAGTSVSLTRETMTMLLSYSWPGNVRELQHFIERLVLMADRDVIRPQDIPDKYNWEDSGESKGKSFADLKESAIQKFEKSFFTELINNAGGNVSLAGRNAKMNRSYLIKKLKEYGLLPGKSSS